MYIKLFIILIISLNMSATDFDGQIRYSCSILLKEFKNQPLMERMGKKLRQGYNANSKKTKIDPIVDDYHIALYQADACNMLKNSAREQGIGNRVMNLMVNNMIKEGAIIRK